jgi:hypothetical protein
LAEGTIGLSKEVRVRATPTLLAIGLAGAIVALVSGCRTPPPPRVQIPIDSQGNEYTTRQHDPVKPMPGSATQSTGEGSSSSSPDRVLVVPPGRSMSPAISQAYLESYDRVGRPRLLVLADRTDPSSRSIVPGDYDTLERVIRDALAAEGQVAIVPSTATRVLTDQQLKSVQAGDTKALADVGNQLHADVIILVQVAPTAAEREERQITATARNARDAQQIAKAASSIPPPPQRRQLDFAGRLLAERLVDELAGAWENLSRIPPAAPATQPRPATQPERAGFSG